MRGSAGRCPNLCRRHGQCSTLSRCRRMARLCLHPAHAAGQGLALLDSPPALQEHMDHARKDFKSFEGYLGQAAPRAQGCGQRSLQAAGHLAAALRRPWRPHARVQVLRLPPSAGATPLHPRET